jgi:hypothetical protein
MSLDPERQAAWKLLFERMQKRAKAAHQVPARDPTQPPPGTSAVEWRRAILDGFKAFDRFDQAVAKALDEREIVDCPFCEGAEFGCCWCDHTGHVDADTEAPPSGTGPR